MDAFITDLHRLAKHCGYGALHNEMIRDHIVAGLRDATLSEKLQMDSKLTLEKAVRLSRESETIKKQQPLLRGQPEQQSADLGAVQTQKSRNQTGRRTNLQKGTSHKTVSAAAAGSCSRCGHSPHHDQQRCLARQARCRKCGKLGHFQAVCHSKNVREVSLGNDGDTDELDVFLGTVTNDENESLENQAIAG